MATAAYESREEIFSWEDLSLHQSCPLKLLLSHLADVSVVTELYFGCKLCAESVALYQGEETFIDHIRTFHQEFYQDAPITNDEITPKVEAIELPPESQLTDSQLTSKLSQLASSQTDDSDLTESQLSPRGSQNVILTAAGDEEAEAIEGLIRAGTSLDPEQDEEQNPDFLSKIEGTEEAEDESRHTYVIVEEQPTRTRIEIQPLPSEDAPIRTSRRLKHARKDQDEDMLSIQNVEVKEEIDETSEESKQALNLEPKDSVTIDIKPEPEFDERKDEDLVVQHTNDQQEKQKNEDNDKEKQKNEDKKKYGSDLEEEYEEELDYDARARPRKWSERFSNTAEKQRVLDLIRGRKIRSGSADAGDVSQTSTQDDGYKPTVSNQASTSGLLRFRNRFGQDKLGRFTCRYCGKVCKHRVALKEHENTHLGIKPHKCSVCNKSFTKKSNMSAHMRIHSDIKPWACEYCGKTFREKSQCVAHTRVHSDETPWPCRYCEKSFKDKATKNKHEMIHTGEKPHVCETCGMAFRYRTDLTIHVLDHQGRNPLTCQQCGKKFNKRHNYTKHLRVHTGEKNYECSVCESRFREKSHLNRHMRLHSSERPYRCNMGCDKAFPDISSLNKHTRTHTTAYKCSVCDKTFSQKHHATRHLLIHLGK